MTLTLGVVENMGFLKSVYNSGPVWLQNLMVSGQGLVYAYVRWDPALGRKLLAELRESQWWSRDRFEDYQTRKLRHQLCFAASNIPHYRELFKKEGFDPDSVRHVDDLRNIPILEKSVIRSHPNSFLWGGRARARWNTHFTSGTTGTPMRVYTSRESFTRIWSFVFRLRDWAGISDPIFPKRVVFTGRNFVSRQSSAASGIYWRWNYPGRALLVSIYHISPETIPGYVKAMWRQNPELIDGYPSPLVAVARLAERQGLQLPRPKAIVLTSETLIAEDRDKIEKAFGTRVMNQYAATDTGAFICECEHGNLHVSPEFGICEVLNSNGTPAKPGEEGEIVATPLTKQEQVFIRYRTGDRVIVGPTSRCACGRSMPRVEAVLGREEETLYIPGRGFMQRFDAIFKGVAGIFEAQVVQENLHTLELSIVPEPGYNAAVRSTVLENLQAQVGDKVTISCTEVEAIPRGPNGKFSAVVSRCREQYPAI